MCDHSKSGDELKVEHQVDPWFPNGHRELSNAELEKLNVTLQNAWRAAAAKRRKASEAAKATDQGVEAVLQQEEGANRVQTSL